MCHYQSQTGKLRYTSLRYFNACGAGSNVSLGEDHRPESHLIPLIIKAAMGKKSEVQIYGTDLDQNTELIYNLGNGKGYSVKEVINMVKKVSGKDFKVVETDRRPGDPPVLTSDATKAGTELGWKPQFPELEKIIATAWQWHNEHPDGYPD
ncbi:MAG: NAD-dependent epimerase/dehydratase family protein, partial [Planctomycetota bacterium]|jgi:UDP-glucose 4-epimerase